MNTRALSANLVERSLCPRSSKPITFPFDSLNCNDAEMDTSSKITV